MQHYLIEFRFQSKRLRRYLSGHISEINNTFRVGKGRQIPHITLAGPLTTRSESRLIHDFVNACSKAGIMKFKVDGFGTFDSNRVVFAKIKASDKLNDFRIGLVRNISPYCKLQDHDRRTDKERFGYHSTLAMKLTPSQFEAIKNHIKRKPIPQFQQIVLRVTLLKGPRILREYDFMQRRLLTRREALDRRILRRSADLLRQYFVGKYTPEGQKLSEFKPHPTKGRNTIWQKILSVLRIT